MMGGWSTADLDDRAPRRQPMDEALQLVIAMSERHWKRFKDEGLECKALVG